MFCCSRNHFKKHGQVYKTATYKIFVTLNSFIKHKVLIFFTVAECDIVGVVQLKNVAKLFSHTWPNFSNSWSSFWFSLKASKAQRASNWKTRPGVLKQILGRVFCQREFLKTWSGKSTIYSLKYNLIISNLHFRLVSIASIAVETISWSTRAFPSELVTLVTYTKYLNPDDLIIDIWKKKKHK